MNESLSLLEQTFQLSALDLDQRPLSTKEYTIANEILYMHQQFQKPPHWDIEDTGVVIYQKGNGSEGFIQLNYFLVENENQLRPLKPGKRNRTEMIDIISIEFGEAYLSQFSASPQNKNTTDAILTFQQQQSFVKTVQLCNKTQQALHTIRNNTYSHSLENIFIHAQVQMLLLYGLEDCVPASEEEHFVCKFLANDIDKEKIYQAKEFLMQRLGNPITIRELSRKVAMNECYLKKGFKEIVGSTIFEFYQTKRMEYARMMLCEQGLNVTEVSNLLGYSSISHFSTAFKKHTGMKPCELLLR